MNLNYIVKMKFGSHLYGTATKNSDTDYKGIFLPTKREIFLNKIPKSYNINTKNNSESKNTSDDIDTEIYSLHYFIKLACEGQTVAMDMLHANEDSILINSNLWKEIILHRSKFYTNNLKAFVGYARKQAAKYGIKGSRLDAANEIYNILQGWGCDCRMEQLWQYLPEKEHLHHIEPTPNDIQQYSICGKIIQATQKVIYVKEILLNFIKEYGKRAQQARDHKGIDWKAISHAVRAAMQVKQIFTEGTITFPLKDAKLLLDIKNGKMDYTTQAAPLLESLMDEVEELSKNSSLPNKVDRKFWDNFIYEKLEKEYG